MDAIIEKEFYTRVESGRMSVGADKELALFLYKMGWYACANWELENKGNEEDYQDDLSDIEALVTGG